MTNKIQKNENGKGKMSFFDYTFEVVGWLRIVVSPLIVGLVVAALIYFSNPSSQRLIIAIGVVLIGLIVGILWATRVWKKRGTIHFVSRVMASPDLDNLNEEKK